MVEMAAYTASRLQLETREYACNLPVGLVTVVSTLTPEELEQSKVAKFKPELGVELGAAVVSPVLYTQQVKWSKKAQYQV